MFRLYHNGRKPAMRGVTAAEMRRLDRRASSRYGIPAALLMENAGEACARHAERLARGRPIAVLCGKGNNGGDGYVAARRLALRGRRAAVFRFHAASELSEETRSNLDILRRLGVRVVDARRREGWRSLERTLAWRPLVVDALLGTGLTRAPEGLLAEAIRALAASRCPVLAIDVPSGLDADTGRPPGVCVRARLTVSLAAPKRGFARAGASRWTGRVVVEDISLPMGRLPR